MAINLSTTYYDFPPTEISLISGYIFSIISGVKSGSYAWSKTFEYFSPTASVGDYVIFECGAKTKGFKVNLSTAVVATTFTGVWEYNQVISDRNGTSQWAPLTVTDGTNSFQNTGINTFTWTPPTDWITTSAGGLDTLRTYKVRFRITAVTGQTSTAAQQTDYLKVLFDSIDVTGQYDSGTVATGTATYITDNTKAWVTNSLVGRMIWINSGTGVGQYAVIKTNTATVIYFGLPAVYSTTSKNDNYGSTSMYGYDGGSPMDTPPAGGDTYVISWTMVDVLAADTAGVWGLVSHLKYRYFNIAKSIHIDTSGGFFSGLFESWIFEEGYLFTTINTGARVALGYYNPATQLTGGGCTIYINSSSAVIQQMDLPGWIMDSKIINQFSFSFTIDINLVNTTVINTDISGINGPKGTNANTVIKNMNSTKVSEPMRNPDINASINNYVTSRQLVYAVSSNNFRLVGGYTGTSGDGLLTWNYSGICELVNIDPLMSSWDVNWAGTTAPYTGIFKRIYTVDIKVLDEKQNPIQNAKVTLTNVDTATQFDVTTDANGNIVSQEVLAYTYTHDGSTNSGVATNVETSKNPFILKVQKSGFELHINKFNLTKQVEWVISLERKKSRFDSILG